VGLAADDTPDEEVIQWVLIDSVQWRWRPCFDGTLPGLVVEFGSPNGGTQRHRDWPTAEKRRLDFGRGGVLIVLLR
jgi:hypothetical protein